MDQQPILKNLGAIVLCGGVSRRMGRAKSMLPFGAECLLQRVTRLVRQVAGPVVVVAAPGQEVPDLPRDVVVARDEIAGRGPLSGLAAGLTAFDESVDFVYATATDAPFFKPRWIRTLAERIDAHDLAIPFIKGYHHPLAALYRRRAALPVVRRLLAEDRRSLVSLVDELKALILGESDLREIDPTFDTIFNVNTPDDYLEALRRAGFDDDANSYLTDQG